MSVSAKGLCKVKKNSKNSKKIGSGWVGPGLIWIKKIENRPKTKFCVCTIRPNNVPCGAATSNQRLVLVDMLSAAITS